MFLAGTGLMGKIQELLKTSEHKDLGVAFWGRGAADRLGLGTDLKSVRVICDARSGACNPDALKELLSRKAKIWTKDGFHAKVYLAPTGVIVGSANASANGLGEEGDETRGAPEAAIFSSDHDVVTSARRWFEKELTEAKELDAREIEELRTRWKLRRRDRPTRKSTTLLQILDRDPGYFRDRPLRIVACKYESASKAAKSAYDTTILYTREQKRRFEKMGYHPFYESDTEWDTFPGEYIIDFDIDKSKKATFQGVWRVRHENSRQYLDKSKGHEIIWLDLVDKPLGLKFPKYEEREFAGRLTKRLRGMGPLRADIHGSIIDLPLWELSPKLSRTK